MARPTIENIRGLGDFATLYQWNLSVIKPASAVAGFPSSEDMNYRCESTDLPSKNDEKIDISVRGHHVFQPGVHTYSTDISLTFIDTVDSKMQAWLEDWSNVCWEVRTGKQKLNSEVKADLQIARLNRQDETIWIYKLVGCYLDGYELGTAGTGSEAFKPVLKLTYDYFESSPNATA